MEWLNGFQPLMEFLVPLLAAFIGGLMALAGVWYNEKLRREREQEVEKDALEALLKSIRAEIGELWNRYKQTAAHELMSTPEGAPFTMTYPISGHTYFRVFDSQAAAVGRLQNDELRRLIIEVYIKAKGFVDSFKFNNEMCGQMDKIRESAQFTTNPAFHKAQLRQKHRMMVAYAAKLKEEHVALEGKVGTLFAAIDQATSHGSTDSKAIEVESGRDQPLAQ